MSARDTSAGSVYLDFGAESVKLLGVKGRVDLPLSRTPDGAFTAESLARFRDTLRPLLSHRKGRVVCGLPGQGVALRRLSLPAVGNGELRGVLELQVEREFPLPPEDMAWGYQLGAAKNGDSPPRRDATVVALRRSQVEPYLDLLAEHHGPVVLRVGALAARAVCEAPGRVCYLDLGRDCSEVACFEDDSPVVIRSLDWGGEMVTRRIARALEIDRDAAERTKLDPASLSPEDSAAFDEAVRRSLDDLIQKLADVCRGFAPSSVTFFLAGGSAKLPGLEQRLSGFCARARFQRAACDERATAIHRGLRHLDSIAGPTLDLAVQDRRPAALAMNSGGNRALWLFGAATLTLIAFGLLLPALAPMLKTASLRQATEAADARLATLPALAPQLTYLEELASKELWILETLETLGDVAPDGFRLGELKLDQRRSFYLTGTLAARDDVHELRRRLTACGVEQLSLPECDASDDRIEFRMIGRLPRAMDVPVELRKKLEASDANQ